LAEALINRNVTHYDARCVGLDDADLSEADLGGARLVSTSKKEFISLKNANLKCAKLSEAILYGADLSGADLTNATVSYKQLATCKSLEGATMPDGQILKSADNPGRPTFEEWRKSKGREEDGENSGPQ
jgi:uncharacterized protein YjbI with pentapeptide repeats